MPDSSYLLRLLQMMESSMPVLEVIHSLHTQAMMDPDVRNLPALERFSDVGMHHLHAMIAVAGYIRRMLSGDTSPAVLKGLREQLKDVERYHADTKASFAQLLGDPEARGNEAMQSLSQVLGLADQAQRALAPAVAPLLDPETMSEA